MIQTDTENNELAEVRVASEEVFDGVILHLYKDDVRLPNGDTVVREVIRHIGAVCIAAILSTYFFLILIDL